MAKKSTKKVTAKKTSKKTTANKSHGELFDKHPNLLWLLPIFFLVAGIAVYMINNMYNAPVDTVQQMADEKMVETPNVNLDNEAITNDPITNDSLQ